MNYVEGFGEKALFTKEEAAQAFKEQAASTNLPYIYLSAGVSADLFQKHYTSLKKLVLHLMVYFAAVQLGEALLITLLKAMQLFKNGSVLKVKQISKV